MPEHLVETWACWQLMVDQNIPPSEMERMSIDGVMNYCDALGFISRERASAEKRPS